MSRRRTRVDSIRRRVQSGLRLVSRLWANPDRLLTTLAILVGLTTGVGAMGFSALIDRVQRICFDWCGGGLAARGVYEWLLPLLPMGGALLVGLITFKFAPEAEGHGVPEVMDAMARRGGHIRPRVAGAKAVASALTIGSGGSAGTEGPIIQIGAAIGSGFGQWLQMSLNDLRVLIGCGAAAGIAAIFHAPIAGVLFAIEVLLRDVSLRNFVPIIISAVISSTVTQAVRGHSDPIFPVPHEFFSAEPVYQFTVSEIGNYAVLGLLCGLVAVAFVRLLYLSEDLFRKVPVHRVVRPVLGALLLGWVALGTQQLTARHLPATSAAVPRPAVMGNGYPIIAQSLEPGAYPRPGSGAPGWTLNVLLLLLVGKLVATGLTLGSGGSGGVFAPSLFIGATTGGAFGLLLQMTGWFPGASPGAYALVGMAAVVASSIHAPLTATLMIFELTRDYKVIVPIMLATVAGLAVAQKLEPASIYTLKLLRRGVRLGTAEARLLQRIAVRDAPRIPAPQVRAHDPVDRLLALMRTTAAQDFVVLDEEGRLEGMVLGDDLRIMLLEAEALPLLTVSDVMRADLPTVQLDETLDQVLAKFAGQPMHALPVVDPDHPGQVRELITRGAVMNRYYQSLKPSASA